MNTSGALVTLCDVARFPYHQLVAIRMYDVPEDRHGLEAQQHTTVGIQEARFQGISETIQEVGP